MEEAIKNRLILILSVVSAIFFVATVSSCSSAYRQKASRDQEMAKRLDVEEQVSKFAQEKSAFENKIKSLESSIVAEQAAAQATKKAFVQEQLVNQSLKEELEKINKLNETLQEDLKEALVKAKSSGSTKITGQPKR